MTVFNINPAIPSHLANLPEMVIPETLALLLGVKTQTIYQRIWRQKQQPNSAILPTIIHIPGSNRVAFARQSVVDWWLAAQQPTVQLIQYKHAGRPTIASKMAAGAAI